MLLIQILVLMMELCDKQLFSGKLSFVYSVLATSLQTDKGRKLVKDSRTSISKLHYYDTQSIVASRPCLQLER